MERITRKHLERKVEYLGKLGLTVTLDHHQPGGNPYTWAIEDKTGGRRIGWSGRLTASECCIALSMLAEAAELHMGYNGGWK